MHEPMRLKYREVELRNGQLKGFLFSRKGVLGDDGLKLRDKEIPAAALISAEARDKRVVLAHREPAKGEPVVLVLEVYKVGAKEVAKACNRIASRASLERRRMELESLGRDSEMQIAECQSCHASIDLTGFPETPELHCYFCDNVSTDAVKLKEQEKIRVCDKCGFYAVPRGVTCFYFYFLFFIWGFRSQRKHMCGSCMRTEGWKMLAGNLLFIIGVPVAITQLCRAYFGSAISTSAYKGLERANIAGRKGKADIAADRYEEIAARLGGSAISSFNKGRAFAQINRVEDATRAFEESLLSCANFSPAAQGLAACYAMQGLDLDLHPLLAPFKREDEAQTDPPDA